jgi:hypothetical protein
MQESLTLLSAEVGVGITKDESNGSKEVTFARTIAADDDIVFGGEWLNDRLVLVAKGRILSEIARRTQYSFILANVPLKALDDDLLDIHRERIRATR